MAINAPSSNDYPLLITWCKLSSVATFQATTAALVAVTYKFQLFIIVLNTAATKTKT